MVFKVKDHYFKKAKKDNFVARSIYKLEEIDQKYKVIKNGDFVLDLGYFPGSWIQYASKKVGDNGKVVGIDIQPINDKIALLPNVTLFEKDIFEVAGPEDLQINRFLDVVVSDMAPKTSGIKSLDQDRSFLLVEKVFDILPKFLRNDGHFVMKVFESQEASNFLKSKKTLFKSMDFLRPKSTRKTSKEYFVIGRNFKA